MRVHVLSLVFVLLGALSSVAGPVLFTFRIALLPHVTNPEVLRLVLLILFACLPPFALSVLLSFDPSLTFDRC